MKYILLSIVISFNLNKETITCGKRKINIDLPNGYIRTIYSYEEGSFTLFHYKDSSYISIHCGSMQDIPILSDINYSEIDTDSSSSKVSSYGIKTINGKFWRETYFYSGGVTIYYDNVPANDTAKFNRIVNTSTIVKP